MVDVRDEYPTFQEAGGEVVIVTMGSPEQAADFCRSFELPFRLLADPEREAYRAFGLQRANVWKVAGPAVWGPGLKSFLRHGVGKPVGDTLQLAGTFVIDHGGVIRYAYRSANSADHPTNADLLVALDGLSE